MESAFRDKCGNDQGQALGKEPLLQPVCSNVLRISGAGDKLHPQLRERLRTSTCHHLWRAALSKYLGYKKHFFIFARISPPLSLSPPLFPKAVNYKLCLGTDPCGVYAVISNTASDLEVTNLDLSSSMTILSITFLRNRRDKEFRPSHQRKILKL